MEGNEGIISTSAEFKGIDIRLEATASDLRKGFSGLSGVEASLERVAALIERVESLIGPEKIDLAKFEGGLTAMATARASERRLARARAQLSSVDHSISSLRSACRAAESSGDLTSLSSAVPPHFLSALRKSTAAEASLLTSHITHLATSAVETAAANGGNPIALSASLQLLDLPTTATIEAGAALRAAFEEAAPKPSKAFWPRLRASAAALVAADPGEAAKLIAAAVLAAGKGESPSEKDAEALARMAGVAEPMKVNAVGKVVACCPRPRLPPPQLDIVLSRLSGISLKSLSSSLSLIFSSNSSLSSLSSSISSFLSTTSSTGGPSLSTYLLAKATRRFSALLPKIASTLPGASPKTPPLAAAFPGLPRAELAALARGVVGSAEEALKEIKELRGLMEAVEGLPFVTGKVDEGLVEEEKEWLKGDGGCDEWKRLMEEVEGDGWMKLGVDRENHINSPHSASLYFDSSPLSSSQPFNSSPVNLSPTFTSNLATRLLYLKFSRKQGGLPLYFDRLCSLSRSFKSERKSFEKTLLFFSALSGYRFIRSRLGAAGSPGAAQLRAKAKALSLELGLVQDQRMKTVEEFILVLVDCDPRVAEGEAVASQDDFEI